MRTLVLPAIAFAASVAVLAPPPPAEAQPCTAMSLGECKVRFLYRKTPAGVDKFIVKCNGVTLDAASNGIDPVAESVTFTLSNPSSACYSDTLAPGSIFRRGLHSNYYYNNPVKDSAGLRLLRLGSRKTAGEFRLRVMSTGADLQCLSGPPVVGLTVGDDCGSINCVERRPGLYDCF